MLTKVFTALFAFVNSMSAENAPPAEEDDLAAFVAAEAEAEEAEVQMSRHHSEALDLLSLDSGSISATEQELLEDAQNLAAGADLFAVEDDDDDAKKAVATKGAAGAAGAAATTAGGDDEDDEEDVDVEGEDAASDNEFGSGNDGPRMLVCGIESPRHRQELVDLLVAHGYRVSVRTNGQRAADLIESSPENHFQLILCGLEWPAADDCGMRCFIDTQVSRVSFALPACVCLTGTRTSNSASRRAAAAPTRGPRSRASARPAAPCKAAAAAPTSRAGRAWPRGLP